MKAIKTTISLALSLLMTIMAKGQITINNADLISVGDTMTLNRSIYMGAIGDSGINKTWLFPNLTPSFGNPSLSKAMSPSNTPFGAVAGSNLVIFQDSAYSFYNKVTTGNQQGLFFAATAIDLSFLSGTIGGLPSVLRLTTPLPYVTTPYQFNKRISGTSGTNRLAFKFDTSITVSGTTINIDSIGLSLNLKSKHRVNGWGNITVGSTTYPAIRDEGELSIGFKIEVRTYIKIGNLKIPLGWQAFPLPTGVPDQVQKEVRYWANGYKFPIVSFDLDSNGNGRNVTFVPRNPTALEDNLRNSSIKIAPNPVSEQLNVLLSEKASRIDILNSAGQLMYQNIGDLFGSILVPVGKWPNGVYVLKTQLSNGRNSATKFVVCK